jgi:hypothetical protein
MHDNGRYVKLESEPGSGRSTLGRPGGTKKIRRAGFRFVHRFR